MIHPSYTELLEIVNEKRNEGEPEIESRYSLVVAAAKRARQLTDAQVPTTNDTTIEKPLSIAVEELRQGLVHIVSLGKDDANLSSEAPTFETGDMDETEAGSEKSENAEE